MMLHANMPPTGRRRITEAQLKATAGLTGAYAPVSKGKIMVAFKRAAPALSYSRRLVDFIDTLMAWSRDADFCGQWRPIVWPSNDMLADSLGLEISRVKELIRCAINTGLILPVDSGNRKRYGKRVGDRIVYGYGFDLSPLAERRPAFQAAAAAYEARREKSKALRRDISHQRAAILTMTDYAMAEGLAGADWQVLTDTVRNLAARARNSRNLEELVLIAAQLTAQREKIDALISATVSVDNNSTKPENSVDNNPREPENRPHHITTKQLLIGKPIVDAKHVLRKSGGLKGGGSPDTPDRSANAWRGFPMTPAVVLQIAPAFRSLVRTANSNWQEVSEAAHYVRGDLGISKHAYGQACAVLGRYEATTAIAVISAKHDMGLVRSPGGLLRYMVDAHLGGTLRLDRTLFGLIDKAGGIPDRKTSSRWVPAGRR